MSERSLFAAIGVSTLEWRIPLEGSRPVERAAKQASRCRPVVGPEPRWESPRPPLPRRSARESRSRPQAAGPRGKGAEVGPFQRLPPVWRVTRRPPSSKGGGSRSPARGPRPACGRAPVACSLFVRRGKRLGVVCKVADAIHSLVDPAVRDTLLSVRVESLTRTKRGRCYGKNPGGAVMALPAFHPSLEWHSPSP